MMSSEAPQNVLHDSGIPSPRGFEPMISQSTRPMQLDIEYVKSWAGILKITEISLSLLMFLCSTVTVWYGHVWIEFVGMTAFVLTLSCFMLRLSQYVPRCPTQPFLPVELIFCLVLAIFFLIAAILSLSRSPYGPPYGSSNVGATCFFAFVACIVYAVDTVFLFLAWRKCHAGEPFCSFRRTTTTTSAGNIPTNIYCPTTVEPGHP